MGEDLKLGGSHDDTSLSNIFIKVLERSVNREVNHLTLINFVNLFNSQLKWGTASI